MSNLSVENLSRIVTTGDTGALMGQSSAASEMRVGQEMRKQGLDSGGVGGPGDPSSVGAAAGGQAAPGASFSDILRNSVQQVNEYQHDADTAIKELVAGRTKNIHETMLAVERADTSLKMMMQVRNKILDAYKEIMRMQV